MYGVFCSLGGSRGVSSMLVVCVVPKKCVCKYMVKSDDQKEEA